MTNISAVLASRNENTGTPGAGARPSLDIDDAIEKIEALRLAGDPAPAGRDREKDEKEEKEEKEEPEEPEDEGEGERGRLVERGPIKPQLRPSTRPRPYRPPAVFEAIDATPIDYETVELILRDAEYSKKLNPCLDQLQNCSRTSWSSCGPGVRNQEGPPRPSDFAAVAWSSDIGNTVNENEKEKENENENGNENGDLDDLILLESILGGSFQAAQSSTESSDGTRGSGQSVPESPRIPRPSFDPSPVGSPREAAAPTYRPPEILPSSSSSSSSSCSSNHSFADAPSPLDSTRAPIGPAPGDLSFRAPDTPTPATAAKAPAESESAVANSDMWAKVIDELVSELDGGLDGGLEGVLEGELPVGGPTPTEAAYPNPSLGIGGDPESTGVAIWPVGLAPSCSNARTDEAALERIRNGDGTDSASYASYSSYSSYSKTEGSEPDAGPACRSPQQRDDLDIPKMVASFESRSRRRRTSERTAIPWPSLNLPSGTASERLKEKLCPRELARAMVGLLKRPAEELAKRDKDGDTALMCLVGNPDELARKLAYLVPLVERLSAVPGALAATNERGEDALYLAAVKCPQIPCVAGYLAAAMTEKGIDVGQQLYNSRGDTLIHATASQGDSHERVLAELLGLRTTRGTALFDLSRRNYDGRTALHVAIESTSPAYWKGSGASSLAIAKLLLKHGAEPRAKETKRGDTALHLAISLGCEPGLVEILLDACPYGLATATNYNQDTPLHVAAAASATLPPDLAKEVCRLLIRAGARPDLPNRQGKTPMDFVPPERRDAFAGMFYGRP